MKSIFILSAAGAGNLGDDLLLLESLRAKRRSKRVIVATFGTPTYHTSSVYRRVTVIDYGQLKTMPLGKNPQAIVPGGSLIWSEERLDDLLSFQERVLAAGGNFDINCGHFDSGTIDMFPGKARKLIENSTRLTVRDPISKLRLLYMNPNRKYAIKLDPVFLRAKKIRRSRKRRQPTTKKVGIALGRINSDYISILRLLLPSLIADGFSPYYLEQCEHTLDDSQKDSEIHLRLQDHLGIKFPYLGILQANSEEHYSRLQEFTVIISSRNHLLLMASGLSVPFVLALAGGVDSKIAFLPPSKSQTIRILGRDDPQEITASVITRIRSGSR